MDEIDARKGEREKGIETRMVRKKKGRKYRHGKDGGNRIHVFFFLPSLVSSAQVNLISSSSLI